MTLSRMNDFSDYEWWKRIIATGVTVGIPITLVKTEHAKSAYNLPVPQLIISMFPQSEPTHENPSKILQLLPIETSAALTGSGTFSVY